MYQCPPKTFPSLAVTPSQPSRQLPVDPDEGRHGRVDLGDDAQLPADLDEGRHGRVDLLAGVGRADLHPGAREVG